MAVNEFRNSISTAQPASGGRTQGGMRVRGETKAGSPCAIFEAQRNERRQVRRPSERWNLGRFFDLGNGLGLLLRLGLGCELLLDLGRDGVRINLVQGGGIPKHIRSVVT